MEVLILFVLACYGLTNIVTQSKVCKPLREAAAPWPWLSDLLHCPMCFGFWAGLALTLAFPYHPFIGALVGSGATWIIHVALMGQGAAEL